MSLLSSNVSWPCLEVLCSCCSSTPIVCLPDCSDLLVTSEATNRTARLHFTNYNEEVGCSTAADPHQAAADLSVEEGYALSWQLASGSAMLHTISSHMCVCTGVSIRVSNPAIVLAALGHLSCPKSGRIQSPQNGFDEYDSRMGILGSQVATGEQEGAFETAGTQPQSSMAIGAGLLVCSCGFHALPPRPPPSAGV